VDAQLHRHLSVSHPFQPWDGSLSQTAETRHGMSTTVNGRCLPRQLYDVVTLQRVVHEGHHLYLRASPHP
jgi:hypothetical protein